MQVAKDDKVLKAARVSSILRDRVMILGEPEALRNDDLSHLGVRLPQEAADFRLVPGRACKADT